MRLQLSWLRDYVDWNGSVEELTHTLTRLGIEVESVEHVGVTAANIVIGSVLNVEPHPNADRLRVCRVFDGNSSRQIVCGAPNVQQGQRVAVALPGAELPGGLKIERRTIRGVESEGMICSERELGIGDDHAGIVTFDGNIAPGIPLSELFPPDVVLEIGITPNRADALSHFGIARILAAATGHQAHLPHVRIADAFAPPCTIELPYPDLCQRYAARVLQNVTIAPSPLWMQRRLERAGIRPRNVVVDVTNYVMLECGQPLHAFDFQTIRGGRIIVRPASQGESITTLDGIERSLDPTMLCITDVERPLAIAGVMGGADSAITEATTQVLLEAAYFAPASIRRTAKTLGLQTDASYRFERGADIEMIPYALDRAAALIAELTGASVSTALDVYPHPRMPKELSVRIERAQRILGVELSSSEVKTALIRSGFALTEERPEQITVRVPSYRADISQEIDLLEEIAIAHGYEAIPASSKASVPYAAHRIPEHLRLPTRRAEIRRWLADVGFYEALSFTLQDPQTLLDAERVLELANPLGRERSVLRQWLIPSMVEILSRNARYGASSMRLFEIGKVFFASSDGSNHPATEHEHLVLAVAGRSGQRHWLETHRWVDFYDLKGAIEAMGKRFRLNLHWQPAQSPVATAEWLIAPVMEICCDGHAIGIAGQIAPRLARRWDIPEAAFLAELSLEPFYRTADTVPRYQAPSPYPVVERDLALIVDRLLPAQALVETVHRAGGDLLRSVEPFDVFEHPSLGEGKKSIALHLTFASSERTLTDAEVEQVIERVLDAVARQHGAQLRTL
ncbi:Phenylalanine--tRNA ligase beta subunit [bacterium HR20]|nr:Phenylalanine--tRNA ligase beta subunit [bacterium HR20]